MQYLLDTNIIVTYSRENKVARKIEDAYNFVDGGHQVFVSVVTLGELDAISKKLSLGLRRRKAVERIIASLVKLEISYQDIVEAYGDIDAYSQGKLPQRGPFTARNMGKNDLWIAATAHVYGLTLVTMDRDFDHLAGSYLDLEYVDLASVS